MRAIFLDTETGGLNPSKHPLLEIAFIIKDLNSKDILSTYSALIKPSLTQWQLCDKEALKINGFKLEEFHEAKELSEIADEVFTIFEKLNIHRKNAVFICQNPSFDRVFFSQLLSVETQEFMKIPYHWLDLASMFWSYCMLQSKEKTAPLPWEIGFTKDKIASYFQIASENHPHRALQGVEHLIKCYEAVVGFPKKMLV